MAYPGRLRWELNNGVTGTFTIETPPPEMITALITAMQNELPVTIPEITAMPEIIVTEVTYTVQDNGLASMEVWFREPNGAT